MTLEIAFYLAIVALLFCSILQDIDKLNNNDNTPSV